MNLETQKEAEEKVAKKNNKKEGDYKEDDNKSTNAGYDTTTTGGYEKDPIEPEDDNMELAEKAMEKLKLKQPCKH